MGSGRQEEGLSQNTSYPVWLFIQVSRCGTCSSTSIIEILKIQVMHVHLIGLFDSPCPYAHRSPNMDIRWWLRGYRIMQCDDISEALPQRGYRHVATKNKYLRTTWYTTGLTEPVGNQQLWHFVTFSSKRLRLLCIIITFAMQEEDNILSEGSLVELDSLKVKFGRTMIVKHDELPQIPKRCISLIIALVQAIFSPCGFYGELDEEPNH